MEFPFIEFRLIQELLLDWKKKKKGKKMTKVREAKFEFQGRIYYMKKPRREGSRELLLVIDGIEILRGHKKCHLKPIQKHFNIESDKKTSTHQRADAIFDYIERKPQGVGLKILPI